MRTGSLIALGALLAMPACRGDITSPSQPAARPSAETAVAAAAADSVILMVAGDMHPNCKLTTNGVQLLPKGRQAKATAAIVQQYPQALVIVLGDNAGYNATAWDYNECYERTWGAFKSRTYPTIGNHESNLDPAATPYYDYFNGVGVDSGRAGHRLRGYYTLNHGAWRILVANNNKNVSDQTAWLTRELAANPTQCTMAIWHRPLFTSSAQPANVQNPGQLPAWWNVLYKAGADVVLHGHVHNYERFVKLTPDGVVDTDRGIREFVVGTGGSGLYDFMSVPRLGSQKRIKTWGVLKLTLWPTQYRWQFIDTTGAVLDEGQDTCDAPTSSISLTASGYSKDTKHFLRYNWSGAVGEKVDLYRNDVRSVTTLNDGHQLTGFEFVGTATYRMKVCQAGTTVCSAEQSITLSN